MLPVNQPLAYKARHLLLRNGRPVAAGLLSSFVFPDIAEVGRRKGPPAMTMPRSLETGQSPPGQKALCRQSRTPSAMRESHLNRAHGMVPRKPSNP
eukprot:gene13470-biopygen4839